MADHRASSFYRDKFQVGPGREIKLKEWLTDDNDKPVSKEEGEEILKNDIQKLSDFQEKVICL